MSRKWTILATAMLGLEACGSGEVAPPESRALDARFAVFHPGRLPACGPLASMPPRGQVPSVEADGEGTILLEVPGSALEAYYHTEEPVPLWRLPESGFEAGTDAVELPAPSRAWRLEGSDFEPLALDDPGLPRLALALKNACVERLEDRCARGDGVAPGCVELEESVDIYIPEALDRGLGAVLPLGADAGLAIRRPSPSSASATLFRLDVTASRALETPGLPAGAPYLAAYQRREGDEVWLHGPSGALARGTLSGGFTVVRKGDDRPPAAAAWVDGPHDASPFELFLLDASGFFARFDGQSLTVLAEPPGMGGFVDGAVVWIRPGEAIAVGARDSEVLRYKDGALTSETFSRGLDDRPTAAALVPGLGVVVGTARGALHLDDGSGWQRLESPDDGSPVHGIIPLEDGFLFGRSSELGSGGRVVQYTPGVGLCRSLKVTAQSVQRLYPMRDGFLVYSKDPSTHAFVSAVRRKSSHPSCEAPAGS